MSTWLRSLFFTRDEAAAELRRNPWTLDGWRKAGKGPKWVRGPWAGLAHDVLGHLVAWFGDPPPRDLVVRARANMRRFEHIDYVGGVRVAD